MVILMLQPFAHFQWIASLKLPVKKQKMIASLCKSSIILQSNFIFTERLWHKLKP